VEIDSIEQDSIEHMFWTCRRKQMCLNGQLKMVNMYPKTNFWHLFHSRKKIKSLLSYHAKFNIYLISNKQHINNHVFKQKFLKNIFGKLEAFQNESLDNFSKKLNIYFYNFQYVLVIYPEAYILSCIYLFYILP
jgi:hypothetical protein